MCEKMCNLLNLLSSCVVLIFLFSHGSAEDCADDVFKSHSFCRRNNAFYPNGKKALCQNKKDDGACASGESLWYLNFDREKKVSAKTEVALDAIRKPEPECPIKGPDTKSLFAKEWPTCLQFQLPVCEDGNYEVSMWTGDRAGEKGKKKCFDVYFDDEHVTTAEWKDGKGDCALNELIILFTVQKDRTEALVQGASAVVPIHGGIIGMKICFDKCKNEGALPQFAQVYLALYPKGKDDCFRGSLISAHCPNHEPKPDPTCNAHNDNICGCKLAKECEYAKGLKKCIPGKIECSNCGFGCRRRFAWYSEGGILCKNYVERGDCRHEKVIMAVNMNGEKHTDVDGIEYQAYKDVPYEHKPDEVVMELVYETESVHGVAEKDIPLYQTYVTGDSDVHKIEECMSYLIPLSEIGYYELSIKYADFYYVKPGEKSINYRFNGMDITVEMDMLVHTVDRDHTANLNLNFWVIEGGAKMEVPGYGVTDIKDGKVKLEICHGTCSPESFPVSNWHISAWSVIKFQTAYSSFPEHTKRCGQHKGDRHTCVANVCDYNLLTQECTLPDLECPIKLLSNSTGCVRANAYYLDGTKPCRPRGSTKTQKTEENADETGSKVCQKRTTVFGRTFASMKVESEQGIIYEPLAEDDMVDTHGLTETKELSPTCAQKRPDLKKVHSKYITGKNEDKFDETCVSFKVSVCTDGPYELSVLTLNENLGHPNERCFDLKLNNVSLTYSIDPGRITRGDTCTQTELIVPLTVSDQRTKFIAAGHPTPTEFKEDMILDACFGVCGFSDPNIQISGFALVGYGDDIRPCERCHSLAVKDNPNDCIRNGCEFYEEGGRCVAGRVSCEAKAYKNVECSRGEPDKKFGDCNFFFDAKLCQAEDPIFDGRLTCRRPGTFYVYHPKIWCKGEAAAGDCKGAQTYAVNLNGKYHKDKQGLQYIPEADKNTVIMTDAQTIRKGLSVTDSCKAELGADPDLKNLYGTAITNSKDGCVSYEVSFCQDGDYELIIRTIEPSLDKIDTRCFDIKLNGVPIFMDVNPFRLAGGKCKPVELSLMFIVKNVEWAKDDEDVLLYLKGRSEPLKVKNTYTTLEFCSGQCAADKTFVVSGFSLFRFGDKTDRCGMPEPKELEKAG